MHKHILPDAIVFQLIPAFVQHACKYMCLHQCMHLQTAPQVCLPECPGSSGCPLLFGQLYNLCCHLSPDLIDFRGNRLPHDAIEFMDNLFMYYACIEVKHSKYHGESTQAACWTALVSGWRSRITCTWLATYTSYKLASNT